MLGDRRQRSKTYVVVMATYDHVSRVDFHVRDESIVPVDQWHRSRDPQSELPRVMTDILRCKPPRGKRLVVLTDEVWAGQVSLDDQFADVTEEADVEQALAFEVESQSGLAPFQSRLGLSQPIAAADGRVWAAVQMEQRALQSIVEVLPPTLRTKLAVASIPQGDEALRTAGTTTSPLLSSPLRGAGWMGGQNAAGISPAILSGASEEDSDSRWVQLGQEWLRRYLEHPEQLPVILHRPVRWSRNWDRLMHGLLALLMIAFCLGHYGIVHRKLQQIEALHARQTAERQTLKTQKRAGAADLAAASQQRQELLRLNQQQTMQVAAYQREACRRRQEQQQAIELLRSLLQTASAEHALFSLELSLQRATVAGWATSATAARQLWDQLSQLLAASPWAMQPMTITVLEHGAVQFEIQLETESTTEDTNRVAGSVTGTRGGRNVL